MKKLILSLFALMSISAVFAGEPPAIIKELHAVMADAPKGFSTIVGAEESRDLEGGYIYFEAKNPVSSLAANSLFDKIGTKDRLYMIYYGKEEAEENELTAIAALKKQYEEEFLRMQSSGKYRVSSYKEGDDGNGDEVFEVNDLKGNHIFEYHDGKEAMTIMFWGRNS